MNKMHIAAIVNHAALFYSLHDEPFNHEQSSKTIYIIIIVLKSARLGRL